MAKFCGIIGFSEFVETVPGVFEKQIVEHTYYGDVIRNIRKLEATETLNDNIGVNNSISIMADAYAEQNFFAMVYVEWMGHRWKITSVEVQRPRLILTVGGIYNGPTT